MISKITFVTGGVRSGKTSSGITLEGDKNLWIFPTNAEKGYFESHNPTDKVRFTYVAGTSSKIRGLGDGFTVIIDNVQDIYEHILKDIWRKLNILDIKHLVFLINPTPVNIDNMPLWYRLFSFADKHKGEGDTFNHIELSPALNTDNPIYDQLDVFAINGKVVTYELSGVKIHGDVSTPELEAKLLDKLKRTT